MTVSAPTIKRSDSNPILEIEMEPVYWLLTTPKGSDRGYAFQGVIRV
jgi:hypothetical protein